MKSLILVVSFITISFSSVWADGKLSPAENVAAMKAGHARIAAKTTELERTINSNNMSAAQVAARDVLELMRTGMKQLSNEVAMAPKAQQVAKNNQYNKVERIVYQYSLLVKDVPGNSKKLVEQAQAFMKTY